MGKITVTAIILNSGIGTRMGKYTENKPKCLVELGNGQTILDRQLLLLGLHGIKRVIITTGPYEQMIRNRVRNYPEMEILLVHNPEYDNTNYIYSMHLIPELSDTCILLLHGDLVFDESVLRKILSFPENGVCINDQIDLPEKDFKGKVSGQRIKAIGVDLFGDDCFALMPFYKMDRYFFYKWKESISLFIQSGKSCCYAEDALNAILEEDYLCAIHYENELLCEIDNESDLEMVRKSLRR